MQKKANDLPTPVSRSEKHGLPTPMSGSEKLLAYGNDTVECVQLYRSFVGALEYVNIKRLEIEVC